jgi:putative cell wall-binding protein
LTICFSIRRLKTLFTQTKRNGRRSVAAVMAAALIASVLALVSAPAAANATVTQTRISGVDRYATSASVALKAYASGTNHVVLVSGESFADGLAASGLAGSVGGPVLLTHPTTLMGSTGNAIGTLDAGVTGKMNIHIIGGTAAVSAAQATTLTGLGYTVTRYSGADRYATAAAVADAMYLKTGFGTNPYNSRKTAFLVTGSSFADGLAIGQIAFAGNHPVLLTNGTSVSAETKAVLDSETYGIKRVHIVGGTSAVSAAVATEIGAMKNALTAIEVKRTSGADRYATAVEVGKYKTKISTLDGYGHTSVTNVVVANGESFADALSASALAGQATDLLVLSAGAAISSATDTYLKTLSTSIATQQLVGGVSALSAANAVSLKAAVVYNKPTATISIADGATVGTIKFSEKMTGGTAPVLGEEVGGTNDNDCADANETAPVVGTGIHTAANFKLNNLVRADLEGATNGTATTCETQDADEFITSLNAAGTVLNHYVCCS